MTISVLIHGTLRANPESRTSTKGNSYVRARLYSRDGDMKTSVALTAFGQAADQLLQLQEGDGLAVAGRGTAKAYLSNKTGDPAPSVDVMVERVISVKPLRASKDITGEEDAGEDVDKDVPF